MDNKWEREKLERDLEEALKAPTSATPSLPSPKVMIFIGIGMIALLGIGVRMQSAEPVPIEVQAEELAAKAAASPAAVLAREATGFYQGYLDQSKACDASNSRVARALKANDVIELYTAASEGAKTCNAAARAVGLLSIPDIDYDRTKEAAFKDARDTCRLGLEVQKEALDALAEMADGDMRVQTQAKMRKARTDADTITLGCAAKMVELVKTSGGKLPPSVDPHAS